ncbi:MAG TPA: hypothetical protein VK191_02035 [Symbiobacteriaceae bacterium]|nr:hypothetical protein [Symbiobacteriaceae bacterium]
MVLTLMVGGLMLAGLSLWQVTRLLREAERAPAKLDALVDELVATAEAATATVTDRAEEMSLLLAAADERIAILRQVRPVERPRQSTLPTQAPSLAEAVGARAAAGQDEATIARELGLARTAVRLAVQAARTGGDR